MDTHTQMDAIILLRNIEVQGANAIAGFTWGFPAITHFLGYVHALQRNLPDGLDVALTGCGLVCHEHQVHAHQADEFADRVFSLTRNPLDKSGSSSSFVEEGKMNMRVSLVIPLIDNTGLDAAEINALKDYLAEQAQRQRLAGGVVVNQPSVDYLSALEAQTDQRKFKKLIYSLLPGFALVSRHDLLTEKQQALRDAGQDNPELHAWLSYSALQWRAVKPDDESGEITWQREQRRGWLCPISVGYRAISPLYEAGQVAKARDAQTPVRFVENLYSLGEWLSPHKVTALSQLVWRYQQENAGDYLCVNTYPASQPSSLVNIS